MKSFTILLLLLITFSCKDENKTTETSVETDAKTEITNTKVKSKTVTNNSSIAFLSNVKSLENDNSANPIETFQKTAKNSAKAIINLNKETIKTALEKAKSYTSAVITVENHTIVKLNLEDCKPSGAWASCMPKAEGYIKKGELVYQNDYANNIIGLPDSQKRLLYLF